MLPLAETEYIINLHLIFFSDVVVHSQSRTIDDLMRRFASRVYRNRAPGKQWQCQPWILLSQLHLSDTTLLFHSIRFSFGTRTSTRRIFTHTPLTATIQQQSTTSSIVWIFEYWWSLSSVRVAIDGKWDARCATKMLITKLSAHRAYVARARAPWERHVNSVSTMRQKIT